MTSNDNNSSQNITQGTSAGPSDRHTDVSFMLETTTNQEGTTRGNPNHIERDMEVREQANEQEENEIQPDGFQQFMEIGDNVDQPQNTISEESAQASEEPYSRSGAILSKIFNGFQTVGGGVADSGSHIFRTGIDVVSEVGSVGSGAFSKVMDVANDMTGLSSNTSSDPNRSASASISRTTSANSSRSSRDYPNSTTLMQTFFVRQNVTPVMVFLRPDGTILVVAKNCILLFHPRQTRVKKIQYMLLNTEGEQSISSNVPDINDRRIVLNIAAADRWPDTDEIIAGCGNGIVRIVSISENEQHCGKIIRSSSFLGSIPTALRCGNKDFGQIFVGTRDGPVHIVDYTRLSIVTTIPPPDMCLTSVGSASSFAGVTALVPSKSYESRNEASSSMSKRIDEVSVGYEDGIVATYSTGGTVIAKPFMAHGKEVGGMIEFYNSILLVSIGSETDTSLSVFESDSGRCISRQILSYVPSWISKVNPLFKREPNCELICPSENVFIVGGEEGQVYIYRLMTVSSTRVELRMIGKLSGRQRKKDKRIIYTEFVARDGIIVAVSGDGEIRRWKLCKLGMLQITLTEEEIERKVKYTAENVSEKLEKDVNLPETGRLNEMDALIRARSILAELLNDSDITEVQKDMIVSEFRGREESTSMQVSHVDVDFRRGCRKIWGKYKHGLSEERNEIVSRTEQCLMNATRRNAAIDMEFAHRRYLDKIDSIGKSTVRSLKMCLLSFFNSLRNPLSASLLQLKRETETLDT